MLSIPSKSSSIKIFTKQESESTATTKSTLTTTTTTARETLGQHMDPPSDTGLVTTHTGGCHCRTITWKVDAPATLTAWKCNCSNCSMRGNTHFIVPAQSFQLLTGQSNITTYTFGTHTAKHTFCSVCGVTSFYTPRSNPDGVAVTLACLDPGTLSHVEVRCFDGQKWEQTFSQSGISACSKLS